MVSRNEIKLITGLHQKKYRNRHGMFIAEGVKVITELHNAGMELRELYTTDSGLFPFAAQRSREISESILKKVSQLKTPNKALALFDIPEERKTGYSGLIVALDDVRDPGNLGTIIRLCDWFGIEDLVCSTTTVDCYNAKVVQATMGSLARVNVVYRDLPEFIKNAELPSFVADMEGVDVYTASLPEKGILVMGNEANGISAEIRSLADHLISIPRFGRVQQTESLNVATATAVLLSEFRRRR
ncbi:TrmH family RNA methyltransferase [Sinomicrobium weinanense]|uniref:RNA methyltransferase n=1 Tax=Sinomicrobium weinanense TaxID=2842200 RepID=A0A926JTM3_9FLAO|nr:RNA methyltransferase [Sinomicrobium weinanense]MBC9797022.1 RNA methyltransferase [Sinomicrobium weinanense]MBU3123280.1 RNA methyltransferase [Sinomicrobium weinanense]